MLVVFNVTAGQMMDVVRTFGISYKDAGVFVSTWSWLRRLNKKGAIGTDLLKVALIISLQK